MYRASLCAVAVIAFGVPFRDLSRRKNAPNALWLRCRLAAARRNAAAARFDDGRVRLESTRPPLILCRGLRPSQLVKCLTLAQRLMSTPISPPHLQRGRLVDPLDPRQVYSTGPVEQ